MGFCYGRPSKLTQPPTFQHLQDPRIREPNRKWGGDHNGCGLFLFHINISRTVKQSVWILLTSLNSDPRASLGGGQWYLLHGCHGQWSSKQTPWWSHYWNILFPWGFYSLFWALLCQPWQLANLQEFWVTRPWHRILFMSSLAWIKLFGQIYHLECWIMDEKN